MAVAEARSLIRQRNVIEAQADDQKSRDYQILRQIPDRPDQRAGRSSRRLSAVFIITVSSVLCGSTPLTGPATRPNLDFSLRSRNATNPADCRASCAIRRIVGFRLQTERHIARSRQSRRKVASATPSSKSSGPSKGGTGGKNLRQREYPFE
ncbi:hypothetical protein [Shinella zoogloeoides]|uniref:hypothetical protein n=1 Tax=Shinella zoogloeoides TaxID=352475 RepID=UPI00299E6CA5|nr:hypothetical protein [Shinella zoogloeoides]